MLLLMSIEAKLPNFRVNHTYLTAADIAATKNLQYYYNLLSTELLTVTRFDEYFVVLTSPLIALIGSNVSQPNHSEIII